MYDLGYHDLYWKRGYIFSWGIKQEAVPTEIELRKNFQQLGFKVLFILDLGHSETRSFRTKIVNIVHRFGTKCFSLVIYLGVLQV